MTTFQEKIGYQFKDATLLERAYTHKSFHNENTGESSGHNERLEFLGDAVLDLALSDHLMHTFPNMSEGDLSKVRASLVNEEVLAELAISFSMNETLRLGKGEQQTGGTEKPRLLASAFEAVIGALYLDANYDLCRTVIADIFSAKLENLDPTSGFHRDFKTRLQELTQEKLKVTPIYSVVNEEGPDHEKTFQVEVRVGESRCLGSGKSKKQAEQSAAKEMIEALKS